MWYNTEHEFTDAARQTLIDNPCVRFSGDELKFEMEIFL